MKRPMCSDFLAGGQDLYEEKLPTILDEVLEQEEEELFSGRAQASSGEKKRRLKVEQVKALEKNFEVENKLDPERKFQIAHDLGLQPRQVAVWFQNRRARWKTKQLERDFTALRSSYDALAADCDDLRRAKAVLLAEIEELKAKLGVTTNKDGSSDSDSSAVVYEENLAAELDYRPEELRNLAAGGEFKFNESSEWRAQMSFLAKEEQSFLAVEETCFDVFSEELNPGFSWYCSDH